MLLQRTIKALLVLSVLIMAVAFWRKDVLPPPQQLRAELGEEPQQNPTSKNPFEASVQGVRYGITPRFTYDLYGLVVSMHDSDVWWDYAHREWNDYVNVVDLCVVWGENIRRDAYRALSISNDQWTCWFSGGTEEIWQKFDATAVSNNHMVTSDPAVARMLRRVRIGDQIHFRGYLVDYTTYKDGSPAGKRVSSIVRTDTGNGACEVVYVDDFEILRATNGMWRTILKLAAGVFAAALLAYILMPVRYDD